MIRRAFALGRESLQQEQQQRLSPSSSVICPNERSLSLAAPIGRLLHLANAFTIPYPTSGCASSPTDSVAELHQRDITTSTDRHCACLLLPSRMQKHSCAILVLV